MKHLGRKLYHLFGGLGLLSLYYVLGRDHALPVYGALFLIVLAVDTARLKIPAFNRFVFSRFGSFVRPSEANKLTGTPPYILGIGLSLYLYRPEAASAAICFLACGDVAATAVGERYGRTKIGSKSLEGTAAFVVAAVSAGFLLSAAGVSLMPEVIILGALVAAGAELLTLPVNDNLIIPLVSGGAMELMLRWTA
jgi:dolichol kinase